jgi:predicted TIM-barrel fold metal-dependent hydrolase
VTFAHAHGILPAMPPLDFRIVDPHIHQWDPYTTPRATSALARLLARWPNLYVKLAKSLFPGPIRAFVGRPENVLLPYLPADYARDAGPDGVDTVVHVEAGWLGGGELGPAAETRWLDALDFGGAGLRLGAIVAHADLQAPRVDALLAAHAAASGKLRGVRHMAARHASKGVFAWCKQPSLYADANFQRGFERLIARGLRFDAWVYSPQLPDLIALARRFPEGQIVLDHVGTPVGAGGPIGGVGETQPERERIVASWRDDLARLAECKNVYTKLSGLAMPVLGFGFHTRTEPPSVDELFDRLGPFIRHALDVFGVERCFFASNFPMDKASAPFERLFEVYRRLAEERGEHAPRALLRENALRFYGV